MFTKSAKWFVSVSLVDMTPEDDIEPLLLIVSAMLLRICSPTSPSIILLAPNPFEWLSIVNRKVLIRIYELKIFNIYSFALWLFAIFVGASAIVSCLSKFWLNRILSVTQPASKITRLAWSCGLNPVETYPIKKRINTELLIDKRAALYL